MIVAAGELSYLNNYYLNVWVAIFALIPIIMFIHGFNIRLL